MTVFEPPGPGNGQMTERMLSAARNFTDTSRLHPRRRMKSNFKKGRYALAIFVHGTDGWPKSCLESRSSTQNNKHQLLLSAFASILISFFCYEEELARSPKPRSTRDESSPPSYLYPLCEKSVYCRHASRRQVTTKNQSRFVNLRQILEQP